MQRNLILPGQELNHIELNDEDNEEYEKVQRLSVKGEDLDKEMIQDLDKEMKANSRA